MTRNIDAAVSRGGRLRIEALEIEGPREDEILVRIAASGICHTDLGFLSTSASEPIILGHEGAGVVEEVGPGVERIRPGDHVVLSYQSCGYCSECCKGHPAGCEHLWRLNFEFAREDGTSAYGGVKGHFFGQSSFATHTLATERSTVRVSKTLDLSLLAPLGCGFQTGAGTVLNSLKVKKGSSVAVLGIGPVGLAAVMAARIRGADAIIAADMNPRRLEAAKSLGATHIIDTRSQRLAQALAKVASVLDYAIDTTGAPEIYEAAAEALKPKGTLALIAGTGGPTDLPGGRKVRDIIQGDAIPQRFIPKMINLHRQGLFPYDRLLTFYDFEDINRAIEDFRKGRVIKPVLRMSQTSP